MQRRDIDLTGQDKKGGQAQIKGDKWRANHSLVGAGYWHRLRRIVSILLWGRLGMRWMISWLKVWFDLPCGNEMR